MEQKTIYEAVIQRGYRDGWTPREFMTRQILKAIEELAELAAYFPLPVRVQQYLTLTAELARHSFDNMPKGERDDYSDENSNENVAEIASEASDVVIPIFVLAEELRASFRFNHSLSEIAERKATADIRRGVRR